MPEKINSVEIMLQKFEVLYNLLSFPIRQTPALRKIYTILALFILVIAQFGYYVFSMYQIHEAKETARLQILKQIPESLLTKIILQDNPGITWEEEGKELKLHGEMYDVVHIKQDGDKTCLYCFNDENESEVLKKVESALKVNLDNSRDPKQKHFENKISTPEWLFEVQDINTSENLDNVTSKKTFNYQPKLSNGNIKKIYSPPDFII